MTRTQELEQYREKFALGDVDNNTALTLLLISIEMQCDATERINDPVMGLVSLHTLEREARFVADVAAAMRNGKKLVEETA